MNKFFEWLKSTRSILAVFFGVGIHVALLMKIINADQYMTLAAIVIGAYFGRKDTPEERGE